MTLRGWTHRRGQGWPRPGHLVRPGRPNLLTADKLARSISWLPTTRSEKGNSRNRLAGGKSQSDSPPGPWKALAGTLSEVWMTELSDCRQARFQSKIDAQKHKQRRRSASFGKRRSHSLKDSPPRPWMALAGLLSENRTAQLSDRGKAGTAPKALVRDLTHKFENQCVSVRSAKNRTWPLKFLLLAHISHQIPGLNIRSVKIYSPSCILFLGA